METTDETFQTESEHTFYVAPGIWGMKTFFVNLYFVSEPGGSWVLIDTGVYGSASKIKQAAEELFGQNTQPSAILLTHGHFDHIGAVKELASEWQAPVYVHQMELPYVTGQSSYPPPDPSVGRGVMAYMSFMYPKKPIDITGFVEILPPDGSVPGLPGWRWIPTPGHSPGHVSFFREDDRVLLAGDAFVTRHGESLLAIISQGKEIHGPPAYFTPDWISAHQSVQKLALLQPEVAATGHGLPMWGEELRRQLNELSASFWRVAVPEQGRYVNEPAITNEQGIVSVPASDDKALTTTALVTAGVVAAAGVTLMLLKKRTKKSKVIAKWNRPYSHNRVATGTPPATTLEENLDAYSNDYP
ncbi:MBL fold metallo-hydrolase [Botryobacter ruber]|uniref:MBL fold metallo-hydrolase n=1 Tax=Botryobacter ruber TaxID=2171629 RepID=UPI001F0C386E|nr:MBL fold metallo-hydrolase [Botryobacter ruber]